MAAEAELMQWIVGGGAGSGGLAVGMVIQQVLAKRNGNTVPAWGAELKATIEAISNRLDRMDSRLSETMRYQQHGGN
jgi:hypothetical protein